MEPQTLMSTAEVARRLKLDRSTITRRAQSGSLPYAYRIESATGAYLFDRAEIERLAEREGATT